MGAGYIRLCCGQSHWGATCPTDPPSFMCCLCFRTILVPDAYVDPEGVSWDICQECGKHEEMGMIFMFMTGRLS